MNWDTVTISQFLRVREAIDKHLKKQKLNQYDATAYVVDVLSILENKPIESYNDIPAVELGKRAKELVFLSQPPKPNPATRYRIDGVDYDVALNIQNIQTGQYLDYINLIETDPDNFARLCAIFCIPRGKTYGEGYDIDAMENIFYEKMLMRDAMGIAFFFTKLLEAYTKTTLTSLDKALKEATGETRKALTQKKEALLKLQHHFSNVGASLLTSKP